MLISSLARAHTATVVRPVSQSAVPFTLQWNRTGRTPHAALTADPPPGWLTQGTCASRRAR